MTLRDTENDPWMAVSGTIPTICLLAISRSSWMKFSRPGTETRLLIVSAGLVKYWDNSIRNGCPMVIMFVGTTTMCRSFVYGPAAPRTLKVTSTRPVTASRGAVPLICLVAASRTVSRKGVAGSVLISVIVSVALRR